MFVMEDMSLGKTLETFKLLLNSLAKSVILSGSSGSEAFLSILTISCERHSDTSGTPHSLFERQCLRAKPTLKKKLQMY